jgi:hypothetical protein
LFERIRAFAHSTDSALPQTWRPHALLCWPVRYAGRDLRVHHRIEPVRLLRTANIRPALKFFISVPEQLDLIPDR